MRKKELIDALRSVERIANYTKMKRLLNNPYKYLSAILHRELIYPKTKQEKIVATPLFYGKMMRVALPASIDIYLTGGKSHSSEIRLARFLIHNLTDGNHFLDIGTHFGYFTLLAAEIVGDNGRVVSFEPTSKSYALLQSNIVGAKNITAHQKAVSNSLAPITFYEFPNLHSEYNTSDISQFEGENWFNQSKPTKVEVQTTTIDHITQDGTISPTVIKIDVEGAEYNVISGGLSFFENHAPQIVMEYLEPKRKNETHKKATELLLGLGFKSYLINDDGTLQPISDIDHYLVSNQLDSDNIVFKK